MNFWTIGSAAVMATAMMGCSVHSQAPIKQVAYDFSDSQHYDRSHAVSPAYSGDHSVTPEDSYEYQEPECEAEACKRTPATKGHSMQAPVGDQYFIEPQPAAPAPATLVAPAVVRVAPAAEAEAAPAPIAQQRVQSPAPIARPAASYDEDEYGYGSPGIQRAERVEVYEHHESQRVTKRVTYGPTPYPGYYGRGPHARPVHRLPPPGVAIIPTPKGAIVIPVTPQAPFILTPPSRLADR